MSTNPAVFRRMLACVAATLLLLGTDVVSLAQESVPLPVAPDAAAAVIPAPMPDVIPMTPMPAVLPVAPAPIAAPLAVAAPVLINLDLTSTDHTLAAPQFVQNAPINVMVGGNVLAITTSSLLTPGEGLAAYQVFSTGQQSILLGAQGNAIGGTFNIGSSFNQYANALTVPVGVTAIQTTDTLNLVGNLTNAGSLFVAPANLATTSVSISALNIINLQGALLTSVLPSAGLPGITAGMAALNLNLTAINNIINMGTISSAGALNMIAGGTITNALPAGITGISPSIMAVNQLMMQAPAVVNAGQILSQTGAINVNTSNLTNSGMMQSVMSNIIVQNILGNTLSVTNTLGSMQALTSIDFQTSAIAGPSKASLNLMDGALIANSVNFTSPEGIIHVTADTISGAVNITGGEALVGVNSGNLSIASLNLSGDPLVFNTNGDVIIDIALFNAALATPGEDWTFLAGRDILAGAGTAGQTFNTGTGANGRLTMAAGVTFLPNVGVGQVLVPGAVVPFLVTGTSATGGSILLTGVNLQTDGRAISLSASGVPLSNPGTITVGNITSSAVGAQAGTVSLAATGAITTGAINSVGGTGFNGGAISIATPQTISSDSLISLGGDGGLGLAGGLGGAISLAGAGNSSITGTVTSQGGRGGDGAAGGGAAGAGGVGGNISMAFGGTIGGQQILSRGGDGGVGGAGGVGIAGGAGGAGGTGGNISLAAGIDITTEGTLSIGGSGGAGGAGDPGGAGGLGGTGGDISMVAARDLLADTVISFGGLGAIGGVGSTPVAGGQGGVGGGGGTGGNISLTSSGRDINVCQVITFGGGGGDGATGLSGTAGGQGGAGGGAGVGGNISLTAARDSTAQFLVSIGGSGGLGALGNAVGGGGNGGAGGGGGTSGNISVTAGRTSTTNEVVTLGGLGAAGGNGLSGGAGGAGGAGGGGGTAGNISVTTTSGDIIGNEFISTGGAGGVGGNGNSGAANGTGGTGGGGGVGGDISLTAGRDAIVCCVISTGGVGGAGGSGQSIGAGGAGGGGSGGGRGGDLSVTVGRNSLVDKLITIGGAGGAGGAGGVGGLAAPGGVGGLGGRGGDISVTAAATIFRDIIITRGGLGGISGPGTPPGVAGATGINGTVSLTTPNAIIDFVAANCVNCLRLNAGTIQNDFRRQVMAALAANTVINCNNVQIRINQCPPAPIPPTFLVAPTTTTATATGSTSPTVVATFPIQVLPTGFTTTIANQCLTYNIYDVKESFLQATEGTQLQVAGSDGVNVSNGQVVVKAGESELTLMPASARVTLKPHAVAVIDSRPGQPTSIVALDSLAQDGVIVHVGSDTYTLQPGEKILITGGITKQQLADGTQIGNTTGSAQDHRYVLRASVNLSEYIPKLAFLQCRTCAFRHYLDSKFQEDGRIASNPMLPVAYIQTAPETQSAGGPEGTPGFKVSSNAVIETVEPDHYKLGNGSLLFQCKNATRIDTPHGQLFAKPSSIVLVSVSRSVTRVRDLHDEHSNDVAFLVGDKQLALNPGKEVTICDTEAEALTLVYDDGMSRRGVTLGKHANMQIVTADFSILNAIMMQPLLMQLRLSKASEDVRATNSIMKSACAISLAIDRYKGPYFAPVTTPGTGIAKKSTEVTTRLRE